MRRIFPPFFHLSGNRSMLKLSLLVLMIGSVSVSVSAQKVTYPATDFGDVKVGETKNIPKKICTVTAAECPDCDPNNFPVLTNDALTGPDASEFSTDLGNFLGQPIPPGQCIFFNVSFTPTRTGSHSAILDVSSTHRQGGALYPLRAGCPVPPLQPITDPLAQTFETGDPVDRSRLRPAVATALTCLENAVRNTGGNTSRFLSSAWRPSAYQAHFREVYEKWQKLKGKTIAGCESVKAEVQQEVNKHKLAHSTKKPASPTGKHTTGDAFDVNLDTLGIPVSKVDELARGCNLRRPFPTGDRVHFELLSTAPQSPLSAAGLMDEPLLSTAATDAVRVKVYQQNLDGRVFYRYSVINNSGQAIVGLRIGLSQIEADSELPDVPSGWSDADGLPLNAAEAPAGWDSYVVTTEESNLVHMAWDVNQASGAISSGQTRSGFSVVLPQAQDPYRLAHWTAILDDATTISGTLEPDTAPSSNPINDSQTFVTQHYDDFLNRVPDSSGLAFWTNQITSCGADSQCRDVKRINVSAAFFLSIEFQQTGYLVYRMYKAAYGDATSPGVSGTVPIIRLQEFLPDTQKVGQGVQVGVGDWQQQLDANKSAFALEFVQRPRFTSAYPSNMTPTDFVNKLNQQAGGVLSASERAQLITELTAKNTAEGRASVIRKVAEDADLSSNELNRAFVLMQYYGYLRRDPDAGPDSNFAGWKFWLDKLNQFNGNYVNAEMVKAFISSAEYRQRFGQ